MKVVRMYTGPDTRTHFEDLDLSFKPERPGVERAGLFGKAGQGWIRQATAVTPDFHTAPRRQFDVILEGSIQLISTNGTRRSLQAGDCFLAEDTEGEGHVMRLDGCSRLTVFVVALERVTAPSRS